MGEDCHLDTCEEHRARKPGLIVAYYDDYDFTSLAGMQERPDINRGSTSTLFPGVGRDQSSVVFQGLLRPTETGWYVCCRLGAGVYQTDIKRKEREGGGGI